jgi:Sugar (and other) transporter.
MAVFADAFHRLDGHRVGIPSRNSPSEDSLKGSRSSSSSRFPRKFPCEFIRTEEKSYSNIPYQVVEITPPALKNIGYKTYIMFAIFNLVAAMIVYCFYPETSYLNLESVDLIFMEDEERDREIESQQKFNHKALQWNVVPRARMAVNEAKARKRAGFAEASGDIERAAVRKDSKAGIQPDHVEYTA